MTGFQSAMRILNALIRHPATKKIANHALRVGTAELVRYIQRRTRGRSTKIHYS